MSENIYHRSTNYKDVITIGKYQVPSLYASHVRIDEHGLSIQLPPEDRLGIIYNSPEYFSDAHGAYKEGYTLIDRLAKYNDAIDNTLLLGDIRRRYIDFGGGPGFFSYGVAQRAVENGLINADEVDAYVFNTDISKLNPYVFNPEASQNFTVSTLNNLPFNQASFGLATCFHVMEHIPPAVLDDAIADMHRVMQPNSALYTIVPTVDGVVQRNSVKFDQIFYDSTHLTFAERSWWISKFERHGFSIDDNMTQQFDRMDYGWVFVLNK